MTNEQIIFQERLSLMERGMIGSTGRIVTVENADGTVHSFPEPEEIHTYTGWKERGFQVQKGSKACASFRIWKYRSGKKKDTRIEEDKQDRMFLIKASFFRKNQVFPITDGKGAS